MYTVPYRQPIFIIQIVFYLLVHHAEENAEESLSQDTTLYLAACDGNGLRQVTVKSDPAMLVLVQLDHNP